MIRPMLRRASLPLALCLALPVSLLASTAHAAPPNVQGAEGKKLRMHFETEFFSFTHYNPAEPANSMMDFDNINGIGFGVGQPIGIDRAHLGGPSLTRAPTYGFGFGAVLLDSRAVLGGEATFVINQAKAQDSDQNDVVVGGYLVPYFRWMFMKGSWVRPYVEARFGFGGGVYTVKDDSGPETVTFRDHTIFPTVGAGGGAMFFLSDFFSLDAGLNLDYAAPHGKATVDPDPTDMSDDWDKDGDLLNVSIALGASIWFSLGGGGGGSAAAGVSASR